LLPVTVSEVLRSAASRPAITALIQVAHSVTLAVVLVNHPSR
jgi:hypothetical protein